MSISIDLKVVWTAKSCKLQRGIHKPLLKWLTIQLLIENGTKRQHATDQLSLIPITNGGELKTQVI